MFKVKDVYYDRVLCYCNWHDDKNASLSISLDQEYYGVYYCFGCGVKGRLSDKIMKELGYKMKKKRDKPAPIDWGKLQQVYYNQYRPAVEGEALSKAWNVGSLSSSAFGAGFDGMYYTFPMFKNNKVCGIQRRSLDGKKFCVEGSKLGLFIPLFYNNPPEVLFICEGVTDAISVYDLGFDSIGRASANSCNDILDNYLYELCPARTIVVADNDEIGIKSASVCPGNETIFIPKTKDIRNDILEYGKEYIKEKLNVYVQERR